MRATIRAMLLGGCLLLLGARPAAAGGFYFSFGLALPVPVVPVPVVVLPPAVAYPAYPYAYYPPAYYAPAFAPPVAGFAYGSGWCPRSPAYGRPGPYGRPPWGDAYGYRARTAYGYRWH